MIPQQHTIRVVCGVRAASSVCFVISVVLQEMKRLMPPLVVNIDQKRKKKERKRKLYKVSSKLKSLL